MEIKHPRRLLAVGPAGSPVLDVLKALTGTTPTLNYANTTAGLTHEWRIETKYYTANIPIWIDEIVEAKEWETEFLKPEAREVLQVIAAYVVCFHIPADGQATPELELIMEAIQTVCEQNGGDATESIMLAVGVPQSNTGSMPAKSLDLDHWEGTCMQHGFEFIDLSGKGTGEFGDKMGFDRLKEALESNDWDAGEEEEVDVLEDLDSLESFEEGSGFDREEAEMTAELFGMKAALSGDDISEDKEGDPSPDEQAAQVDNLERLMSTLLQAKERSIGLPEAQRKQLAARAVTALMKDRI